MKKKFIFVCIIIFVFAGGKVLCSPSDPIMSSVEKVVQPTATISSVRVSGPSK